MSAPSIDVRQLTLTAGGHLDQAPDHARISPALLTAWTRNGAAIRHCGSGCGVDTLGPCIGHPSANVTPGDLLVIGRPGHPTVGRAVYRVVAVGSAGIGLERKA